MLLRWQWVWVDALPSRIASLRDLPFELEYPRGVPAQPQERLSRTTHKRIQRACARMLAEYGPQGWWPVYSERRRFARAQGERASRGYHPGEFDFPRTRKGRWEIVCGAVLTQNTAWTNVEHALGAMREASCTSPEGVIQLPAQQLASLIRPAGYFNQKSRYLVATADWFIAEDRSITRTERSRDLLERSRGKLLAVKGVGPETADSILLYAYGLPTFVVDAYTRRVFGRIGVVQPEFGYECIRCIFEAALGQPSVTATVQLWQEVHALIVEHAKRCHGRNADPDADFLLNVG